MNPPNILWDRKKLRDLSYVQEAWGNRSTCVLAIPEGHTAESYVKALYAARRYSGTDWRIIDGEVVEESFLSIGD
jgi:hypothetical protein